MKRMKKKQYKIGTKFTTKKVLKQLRGIKAEPIVDISVLKNAQETAEERSLSHPKIKSENQLRATYIQAHTLFGDIIEGLLQLDLCAKWNNVYVDAVDEYMPSGPPMSPITN